jgi:hypothetical protein
MALNWNWAMMNPMEITDDVVDVANVIAFG